MTYLDELARVLNHQSVFLSSGDHTEYKDMRNSVTNALSRVVRGNGEESEPRCLRVSSLGKPVVEQMVPILCPYLFTEDETFSDMQPNLVLSVMLGHMTEALVIYQAEKAGFDIHGSQQTIDYLGVPGHIDFILGDFVVDVKSMSAGYYGQFYKTSDDSRGYITQAAVYSEAVGLPFGWLIYNNAERVFSVKYLQDYEKAKALERVNRIVPKMLACETMQDLLKKFKAPDPVSEIFKGEETGRKLLPPSMRYSKVKELFYDIEEGINNYKKPTSYVMRKRTPNEVIELTAPF